MMKKICIYGKGGVGKSTTVANLAAAFGQMGLKVAVIGCDPKADSTRNIMGYRIPSILDMLHNRDEHAEFAAYGYQNILCIESGGPQPGTGCAGRGIVVALETIDSHHLLKEIDVAIYDVLGDVVCGGFSAPLRENVADHVYLVTTSDYMSVYAANNICKGIEKYAKSGSIGLSGLIYNGRSSLNNSLVIDAFAEKIGSRVIGVIPMSPYISKAEIERKTVIEKYPDEEISLQIKKLAKAIYENRSKVAPVPLSDEELEALYMD